MKIVSWNCNGAFRKKFKRVLNLNADIYIIQECENLAGHESFRKELLEHSIENFLWTGENKNKGLGVFSKKNIEIEELIWDFSYRGRKLKYFLPFQVNKKFTILAVWNHHADAKVFSYIGQFWLFLQNNKKEFKKIIICGDFNSNSIWDKWDIWWNHSDCVRELESLNIFSLYHKLRKEKQGEEKTKTFFLHKKKEKSYHIDYFFLSEKFFKKSIDLKIESFEEWIDISDHLPLVLTYS